MNGMKKIVYLISALFFSIISLTACNTGSKYPLPEYESGYFRYAVDTDKEGNQKAYLLGFTELGLSQKYILYPEKIGDIRVAGIGYHYNSSTTMWMGYNVGNFESENLQKMYVPFAIKNTDFEIRNYSTEFEVVVWNYVYASFSFGDNLQIYGYNRFLHGMYQAEIKFQLTYKDSYKNKLANVTYFYNYEDCPNEGYYWVDSWDETLIDYIPPEPTREGYTFGGWYKEPECVNEWNFDTDITHTEIILADFSEKEIRENYEDWSTSLYAKWIVA